MQTLRERATSPAQYDGPDVKWIPEGDTDSSSRVFIKEYLEPVLGDLSGQDVLDVGCGTGWLSAVVEARDAITYTGVDPSKHNIEAARRFHPKANFVNSRIEDFGSEQPFDLIACVMASEHIDDLRGAFSNWRQILTPDGRVLIVAADINTFTMTRFDYELEIDRVSEDEAVVFTRRPSLKVDIADIIRSVPLFKRTAQAEGLQLVKTIPMIPTDLFLRLAPRYQEYPNDPVFQLMEFIKPEADKK
ncbi:MAG TPA: methyltransferase domain-containing protein [Candidatus Saccharimonadales bacterium]|nr:methyltransferase domain-containing protein [Candidatus Saccharimonadales bacterium]